LGHFGYGKSFANVEIIFFWSKFGEISPKKEKRKNTESVSIGFLNLQNSRRWIEMRTAQISPQT
jgi:hypothetical protein